MSAAERDKEAASTCNGWLLSTPALIILTLSPSAPC